MARQDASTDADGAPQRKQPSSVVQRLITGLAVGSLAIVGIFFFPPLAAFATWMAVFLAATLEYAAIVRHWAPSAPLRSLLFWVPASAIAAVVHLRYESPPEDLTLVTALAIGFGLVAVAALTTLLGRCEVEHGALSMGFIAFGIPYFALPPLALYKLQLVDPWIVFLVVAIVAFGDTAAYFVGRQIGRHKIAPMVSPKKTWEGSVAGFLAALATTAIWSQLRLGHVPHELLALAAATSVAGQLGDLIESLVKRGAGVKDSSNVLPGHGGFYDRLDAFLLAAPVFTIGLWILGFDAYVPG